MHYSHAIARRLSKIRCRNILRLDQTPCPGAVGMPIAECGRAFEETGPCLREKRRDKQQPGE
jgi:hypothetical protein